MKIIGHADDSKTTHLIVKMTRRELCDLTGETFYDKRQGVVVPPAGSSYDIRKAWESVHAVNSAERQIGRLAKNLREIGDELDKRTRMLPALTADEEGKNDG